MPTAYLSIGSNIGDREKNCEEVITLLIKKNIKVIKRSSLYETEPWGVKEQPKFINMAVEVETHLGPEELLRNLKEIEKDLGRGESIRWGPRVIDLDILFYDNLIINTPELTIPHPAIIERGFVLKPLSEIAPDKEHPIFKKSIKNLLSECLRSSRS